MSRRNGLFYLLQIAFVLYFFIFPAHAKAQTYDTLNKVYSDYITSYKNSAFGLQFITSNKYTRFQLQYFPNPSTERIMKFRPNESTHLGFGIDYRWLGLRLAFAMPFLKNDDNKYGKTRQLDLQAHVYSRKFITDAYWQSYRGFYIENPLHFNPDWNESFAYPSRRDIRTQTVGASLNYVFNNERLSMQSSFKQTEWQKKSAGSVLTGANFSYFHLRADSSIVAVPRNNLFNDSSEITNVNISQIGWTIGYVYTLVIKRHFFGTLSLNPGMALQTSRTRTEDQNKETRLLKFAFFGNGRFSFGYNGESYFCGIMAVWDRYTLNASSILRMQYSNGMFRFFFGKRFGFRKKNNQEPGQD